MARPPLPLRVLHVSFCLGVCRAFFISTSPTITTTTSGILSNKRPFVSSHRSTNTALRISTTDSSNHNQEFPMRETSFQKTLAGPFLVSIVSGDTDDNFLEKWNFSLLDASLSSVETVKALSSSSSAASSYTLVSTMTKEEEQITIHHDESESDIEKEHQVFMEVMGKLMAQRALKKTCSKSVVINLPWLTATYEFSPTESPAQQLFDASNKDELVDMVDADGQSLVVLPRRFVHKYNLLHRGIGVLVNFNDKIYVHRRASSKRIFPSLYDMFVGGVSLADEPPHVTATREVAEELNLVYGKLSDILFTCTVCTSYNRCVVTVFSYQATEQDVPNIQWQEGEVDWGDFVSHDTVVEAAKLSKERLQLRKPLGDNHNENDWATWDFVPDGLLVWDAWQGRFHVAAANKRI